MRPPRPRLRRPGIRRVVVVVPSLFTLFNLFFGFWSMVLAARGEYYPASWFIVFAGVLDLLDGRVARLSGAGTRFGAELDSLVDLVSFGVAPAFLLYSIHFAGGGPAAWIFCYFYVMAVAIRLARFNVIQAGRTKTYFVGLPSPAAGMTIATYYPFTRTVLYQERLLGLNWDLLLIFLVVGLSALMVSTVRYAQLPRAGLRSVRGLLGLATNLSILIFGIWKRDVFFFPLGIAYMMYGVVRAALLGLFTVDAPDTEPAEPQTPEAVDDAYGRRTGGLTPRGGGG